MARKKSNQRLEVVGHFMAAAVAVAILSVFLAVVYRLVTWILGV